MAAVACAEPAPGPDKIAAAPQLATPGLDLDIWKADLQRLHGTIDQVVQAFISGQTRQLDAVAAELTSQRERIVLKEQRFAELSDSIAGFVEAEAKRLEACGIPLSDPEADARHEAYDAELPGPPALHRINRLWRKATRAFEAQREANERQAGDSLEAQRRELEARIAEAEERCEKLRSEHTSEVAGLHEQLEATAGEGAETGARAAALRGALEERDGRLAAAGSELEAKVRLLEEAETTRSRLNYEWDAERDELSRTREDARTRVSELDRLTAEAAHREKDLQKTCEDQGDKLERMKRVMDEQERELTQKIERVQLYVKERQVGALHAEKKQQDAEKLADRWQGEVRRLQAEKDKLTRMVVDLEGRTSGQACATQGILEDHQREVHSLREALRKKEEEMRVANLELLRQRDDDYQAKISLEKQREKDRSIGLLKKKEQEVQIKDQQLKAAKQRIQELEGAGGGCHVPTAGGFASQSTSPGSTSRGSSATALHRPSSGGRRLPPSGGGEGPSASLPPLPLSAR